MKMKTEVALTRGNGYDGQNYSHFIGRGISTAIIVSFIVGKREYCINVRSVTNDVANKLSWKDLVQ